jgi:uncharacterized membrane protein
VKFEARLFLYGVLFFVPVGLIYGAWSHGEPVGTAGIPMVGGLVLMVGGYLALVARRIDARPEDDEHGEIAQGAGEQGVFSPWSWWPIVCALAASVAMLSLAVGFWMMVIALPLAVIGLVGWIFEFSRGQHAH